MDRLVRRNVLALSGRAVEASGDVDVLLLDKTGTITLGNREATEFLPMPGVERGSWPRWRRWPRSPTRPPRAARSSCWRRSYGIRERELATHEAALRPVQRRDADERRGRRRPPPAQGRRRRDPGLGRGRGRPAPAELAPTLDRVAREGGTPLAVARDSQVLGVVYLKDVVKEGMRAPLRPARAMGIRTVMVTGDNRLTAAKIADEAASTTSSPRRPRRRKLELIRSEQSDGRLIAMTGDGTNDAPALAQADVGVTMNTGTQAAREAGNMVDLDSNPTKLIEIVEVGKQLLITRGALTTFSIANDVAKYFAILPAIFAATYAAGGRARRSPGQAQRDGSGHPQSAIISAIVFNALIIPLLVPLALRGVRYRPLGATALLRRNLWIYGLGGMIVPFVGIKLIDLVVHGLLGA